MAYLNAALHEIDENGWLLRTASLDFQRDFDTKTGRWLVYLRWYPTTGGGEPRWCGGI